MADRETSRPRNRVAPKEQLSPDAWLDAAGRAIAEGGFDDVRILTLARRLGVTRGSFYWHFSDHSELIARFLSRWRDRRLAEITYLRQTGGGDETELHRIFRLVLSQPSRNSRQMRVELAVRDFARRNAYAAKVVGEVDRARIDYCTHLLETVMSDKDQAQDLALLLYVATVGGRVVLASFREREAAVDRLDKLVAEILASKAKPA
jgi:AcrR family transcriptional regulator